MNVRAKVAVVVPAAGKGTRLGGQRKQFRLLDGKPLLIRSLEVFQFHPEVDVIGVAVPAGEEEQVRTGLAEYGITKATVVVAGSTSRQSSVYNVLKSLPDSIEVVLVHDGVRPFVAASQISEVIAEVLKKGAAALAIPVADTMRKGEGNVFGDTVSREGMYRMQTPQASRLGLMMEAHENAIRKGIDTTDDVDLVQKAGYPVSIVAGSSLNIKITTRADWDLACIIWPAWQSGDLE